MATWFSRRRFVQGAAASGLLAGLGDFSFMSKISPVSAAESKLRSGMVKFGPEIEPLVRLLEETPRAALLEEIGSRIHHGLSYREVLTALLLAGIRNVQPRPVGFKFHAVLVINSAHLASIQSPEEQRWLPIFWALDYFKEAQAEDQQQGDWKMSAVDDTNLPASGNAREAFVAAMDAWDESAADTAAAALAGGTGTFDIFELLFRYGCRDFRDIGHKAIYVANTWRALGVIGTEHLEPVVRSLAYALLSREGDKPDADAPADRPIKRSREFAAKFPATWLDGKLDDRATTELLSTLRTGSDQDSGQLVLEMLSHGVAPQSIWDALHLGAGELLARQPGIVALHSVTSTNALHFAFNTAADDSTRRLLLLQNAAFLPLFRQAMTRRGALNDFQVDTLAADQLQTDLAQATPEQLDALIHEIFLEVSDNRAVAARKVLGYLDASGDPKPLIDAARSLVFLKGDNAHDYKFSAAVLEDYYHVSPLWRNRYLAASVFNLRGSKQTDNQLVERTRAALKA